MIDARQLSKRYEDGNLALDAVDVTVKTGQIYCLLGANGAGKTTLMNLFLGFIVPTSGRTLIHGIDVQKRPLEAKSHVAFVDESVKLYPNLTPRQNLRFFAGLGTPRSRSNRRDLDAVLVQVGLPEDAWQRKTHGLSKGMRQKVAIAIAVAKSASVLFLDEPTSGLDPKASTELMELLQQQRDAGCAVLMNTHDIFRARQVADVVGIMNRGHLLRQLSGEELEHTDLDKLYLDWMSAAVA